MDISIESDYFNSTSSSSSSLSPGQGSPEPQLRDILNNALEPYRRNVNICHINAQSVPAHFSDLLATFENSLIHACLISESFLKPSLPSTLFSLPGYHLIRNDRLNKGGGGVAIYLRSDIPYTIVSRSPEVYSKSLEYILIEIMVCNTPFLLGTFYAPPSVNYFNELEQLIEMHLPNYSHSIFMGDFNTCLIRNDARSNKLKRICASSNIKILDLESTFHVNNTNSLLDLILTSDPDRISLHGQFVASGFSHHDLIFASYALKSTKSSPKIMFQRNLVRMNRQLLSYEICNANWADFYNTNNIDNKLQLLNNIITKAYDKVAPLRPVKMKRAPAPWLTPYIRSLMARRDRLKRKHKRSPSDENWERFKKARNRCNQVIRNAKRRHIHNTIETCTTQNLWKFLRSLGFGKSKQNVTQSLDLTALNKHFCSLPVSLDSTVKSDTIKDITSFPLPCCTPFCFEPVTDNEVKKIASIISSKAVGPDNIGRDMVLPILDQIVSHITHLINFSFASSTFPTKWKEAFLIPVPKNSSPTNFSHYRPISILSFFSKILEKVVHGQLSKFLNKHNLFNPLQSGFRSLHSTSTALIKITDDIRFAMDNRQLTLLVLLDFSNAFNCVDYDILLAIMKSLNLTSSVLQWFSSYLRGRRQCIRVDDKFSDWCNVVAGVPQGGVLSPLLFSVFINALVSVINFSKYHLYADDVQLYQHFSLNDLNSSVDRMNSDLAAVHQWARCHGLILNPAKTQVIIIGSRKITCRLDYRYLPKVTLNGVDLEYVRQVKNLGLILADDLSWVLQVNEVRRRIFVTMHSLKLWQKFIPQTAKITLVNSLLLPIFDYADIAYPDITEELLSKLDRLLNLCIRYIFGLRKFDHISQFRSRLKWLDIRFRRNTHLLTTLYGILHNPCSPVYLKERFSYLSLSRSMTNKTLTVPMHKSAYYSDSFTVSSITLWNNLPRDLKDAPSINTFKRKLEAYYLKLLD